ncbi:cyclic nucleotide-binding domain-containing protein [Shinella kummerowiae]|jgi:CRP-like cAMP-binding protein|uniref:Cyclic nucleotide-binding domain-containing protein n=1 Tax=Shinella kummerowiae TaxID=417745 RepID=A0A6N8SDQ5_9HYPH|nr:Crp/Fnr family transcriptional regulator [Shinella kummerowiae]MCT7664776.1 Crp/Fnr family transcriptional regulator [Shinella kummerowiae]MXN46617.1 cyclic nucleotide-binding domain-containing protein [Shinella kummerowiae]
MILNDEVQMLRRVPLFSGIDAGKLKLLAFASNRVSYREGQELFHEGDEGDAAYVVLSGVVDIYKASPTGEQKIASEGCCSVVGEIAILCGTQRNATVKASTAVEALRISKDCFLKVLSTCPHSMAETMRVVGQRLAMAH